MRFGFHLIFLLIYYYSSSQSTVLSGYITDKGNPIHGAHVYNYKTKALTISNTEGKFLMPVELNDSILISHVGYESVHFIADSLLVSETIFISLKANLIMLDEVQVLLPSYVSFKERILETNPLDSFQVYGLDQVDYSQVSYPQPPSTKDPEMEHGGAGVGIRFDLGGLTKKGKELRKYRKLKERETLIAKANHKFNREWVGQITKLEGDRLTDFIAFCKFTPEYIVSTPLYGIEKNMRRLLAEFKKEKQRSNDEGYQPGA